MKDELIYELDSLLFLAKQAASAGYEEPRDAYLIKNEYQEAYTSFVDKLSDLIDLIESEED